MITEQTLVEVNEILIEAAKAIEAKCGTKLVLMNGKRSHLVIEEGTGFKHIAMYYDSSDYEFGAHIKIQLYPTELNLEEKTFSYRDIP